MGLFRPAKFVRQTGRAAPTNFLGYILLFLALATGIAAWSKWPAASAPARLLCLLSAAPGGSEQLGTPRARPGRWSPSHCLGAASHL